MATRIQPVSADAHLAKSARDREAVIEALHEVTEAFEPALYPEIGGGKVKRARISGAFSASTAGMHTALVVP